MILNWGRSCIATYSYSSIAYNVAMQDLTPDNVMQVLTPGTGQAEAACIDYIDHLFPREAQKYVP